MEKKLKERVGRYLYCTVIDSVRSLLIFILSHTKRGDAGEGGGREDGRGSEGGGPGGEGVGGGGHAVFQGGERAVGAGGEGAREVTVGGEGEVVWEQEGEAGVKPQDTDVQKKAEGETIEKKK